MTKRPRMTEKECYIALYGCENFRTVDHYNVVKAFVKAFDKNMKLLAKQFGEASRLRLTVGLK